MASVSNISSGLKKIFASLLFAGSPAKGVVFALSAGFASAYLLFTLVLATNPINSIPAQLLLTAFAPCYLAAVLVSGRSAETASKAGLGRKFFNAFLIILPFLSAVLLLLFEFPYSIGIFIAPVLAAGLPVATFFAFASAPWIRIFKHSWKLPVLSFAALFLVITGILILQAFTDAVFFALTWALDMRGRDMGLGLGKITYLLSKIITGGDWTIVSALGTLLFFTGTFLWGKVFSILDGTRFKNVFGKGFYSTAVLCIATYFFALAHSFIAESQLEKQKESLIALTTFPYSYEKISKELNDDHRFRRKEIYYDPVFPEPYIGTIEIEITPEVLPLLNQSVANKGDVYSKQIPDPLVYFRDKQTFSGMDKYTISDLHKYLYDKFILALKSGDQAGARELLRMLADRTDSTHSLCVLEYELAAMPAYITEGKAEKNDIMDLMKRIEKLETDFDKVIKTAAQFYLTLYIKDREQRMDTVASVDFYNTGGDFILSMPISKYRFSIPQAVVCIDGMTAHAMKRLADDLIKYENGSNGKLNRLSVYIQTKEMLSLEKALCSAILYKLENGKYPPPEFISRKYPGTAFEMKETKIYRYKYFTNSKYDTCDYSAGSIKVKVPVMKRGENELILRTE